RSAIDNVGQHVEVRLGEHEERACRPYSEPLRAQLDLPRGFFPGDVQDAQAVECRGKLHHERRLADAGVAAEENDRTLDDAAPEYPVKLRQPRNDSVIPGDVDILQGDWRNVGASSCAARGGFRGELFMKRGAGSAIGAVAA